MREALRQSTTAGALLVVVVAVAVLLASHRALLAAEIAPVPTVADRPS